MMNRFRAFMIGRNGVDQLGTAMLIAAIAANLLSNIFASAFLSLLALALIVLAFLRMLSRNLAKRQAENRRFTAVWYRTKNRFLAWKDRQSQSKDYKFFTCPGCKNKLRVPRGKGRIQITCPKCGQRFDGRS